jgi:hypothetical protein
MTADPSDESLDDLLTAVASRDAATLHRLIVQRQFVLVSVGDDQEDGDGMGALTAEIDHHDVMVAFTSETLAGEFVAGMTDLFGQEDEVQGFIVDGESLLEYLPSAYGLLLNPETSAIGLIDAALIGEVLSAAEDSK